MSESIYAPHNQHKLEAAQAEEAASSAEVKPESSNEQVHAEAQNGVDHSQEPERPPNPHITKPLLYISGVDPKVTDRELASGIFDKVLPVRLKIDRDVSEGQPASGTVEFQTIDKAEKAYATVRPPVRLRISEKSADQDPRSAAKPRLVKQLPPHTDDAMVFDLFRPFGPLVRAHCILTSPAGAHTGFRGMASLEYYFEKDAQRAQDEMHCVTIGDKTISVAVDTVSKRPTGSAAPEFSASAAPFVPGRSMNAAAPSFSPSQRNVSGGSAASIYATHAAGRNGQASAQEAGPMFPVPGSNLQYSAAAATYIDPCNLFCKNLDPALGSNELFSAFKSFGRIVSARVMRDNEGKSREFGFVSFTTAEEANKALCAMNNTTLGSKQITVRLHEPKKMRQEKLAAKFGGSTSPSDGGMRSPSINGGESFNAGGASLDERSDRRHSNSYYKAALANTEGSVLDEGQLSTLTPVVRREVLSGEFSRRVRDLPGIPARQVDSIVAELVQLRLEDSIDALNNNVSLIQRVNNARDKLPQSPVVLPTGLLSVPVQRSYSSGSATAADNASIMSSAPASSKERERLLKAVIPLVSAGGPVEDITDMLASLPKKDRALCLFNPDFLRTKVEDAREILDITEEDDGEEQPSPQGSQAVKSETIAKEPEASTSATNGGRASSPARSQTYTLATLAELPAEEIVKLATSRQGPGSAGLPLPKADPEVVRQTDEFIDSLAGKPPHDQKQKLGDQLFKKVRSFGVKGAPKITIALLDSEDLRALAHLMNSYEAVLKEKVLKKAAAVPK